MNSVSLAIVYDNPIGVELRRRVRTAGIEGGALVLGRLAHESIELRCRSLIKARRVDELQQADRLQQAERSQRIHVRRVFRRLETHLDVRLRGEIVDLVRLSLLHDADQIARIGHVSVMQDEIGVRRMNVLIKMLDAARVER